MNGGIIGKQNMSMNGLWTPNDVTHDVNCIRTKDIGLIHHFPFTSDINDLFGTLTLTNNNGVTFDENGARLDRSSKSFLSATVTWPSVFTWVWEFKYLDDYTAYNAPMLSIGNGSNIATYNLTVELSKTGTTQLLTHSYPNASNGNITSASIGFTYADSAWHKCILLGRKAGGGKCTVYMDGTPYHVSVPYAVNINTSFAIGRCGAGDWGYGDAYVRNFKVFDRHLTLREILAA